MRGNAHNSPSLVPLVLAGGRGSRLWPVSRAARPKHFLTLDGEHSLLQNALLRAAAITDGKLLIATRNDLRYQVEEEVQALGSALDNIAVHYLLEPCTRNTAPAICAANHHARTLGSPDDILVVLPADHVIRNAIAFRQAVLHAASVASQGRLAILGSRPVTPETAFGYMECGARSGRRAREVTRFVEKPSRSEARQLSNGKDCLWNTGIFCGRVCDIDAAFARHAPNVHYQNALVWRRSRRAGQSVHLDPDTFVASPDISVDYAVLEKSSELAAIETDMDWADIGSWQAVIELVHADTAGNRVLGEAVLVDSHNNYVQSDGRLVAAVGVENLVIVDTPDALLVGRRDDIQKVRDVVERLRLDGHEAQAAHRTVHRPWGTFTVVEEGETHKIKRLHVKPGHALSLQMHHYRSEHWVVLQGTAQVINGDDEFLLERDQSTWIPAGNRHRLENPGPGELVIVETQTGSYLGEDDIVRFDDDYGRAAPGGREQAAAHVSALRH